tara:strand:- start:69 stop:413 length:345 start_codon:yes stop_codon:yes gene_type:complete
MANKTCAWCHKPTNLPEVFAAETPILEWFEKRIDEWCNKNNVDRKEIWGENADWNSVELPPGFEAELLTYDNLLITVKRKTICKRCLVEDQLLWDKYYGPFDEGEFEINIEDLK